MPDASGRVLTEEFRHIVKSKLHADVYTDEQLDRAAFFMVAPVLYNAGEIGAADVTTASILTTANLYAGALLAMFINAGCINVSAIDRFMEKGGQEFEEQEVKNVTSDGGVSSDDGTDAPDEVQTKGSRE